METPLSPDVFLRKKNKELLTQKKLSVIILGLLFTLKTQTILFLSPGYPLQPAVHSCSYFLLLETQ